MRGGWYRFNLLKYLKRLDSAIDFLHFDLNLVESHACFVVDKRSCFFDSQLCFIVLLQHLHGLSDSAQERRDWICDVDKVVMQSYSSSFRETFKDDRCEFVGLGHLISRKNRTTHRVNNVDEFFLNLRL